MGYDYVVGQPRSPKGDQQQAAAGLKVLFNSGAGYESKWLWFNNPGGVGSTVPPNTVTGQPISSQLYADFTKALCMKDAAAPATDLKRKYQVVLPHETSSIVTFYNNYRCSSGIDAMVRHNERLYTLHGGAAVYDGLFLDKVNANSARPIPECFNPCLNDPREVVYPDQTTGQLEYIHRVSDHFKGVLGADGVSGNSWSIKNYAARQRIVPLDLLYNESGKNNDPGLWNVSPTVGAVQLPYTVFRPADHALDWDYPTALLALGQAGSKHAWFGWYGESRPEKSTNSTQLSRALPNWDNLVDATNRQWDALNRVYRSSNSYADPHVIYGRHPKTGKLFVVFQDTAGVMNLRSGEVVTGVQRVDGVFVEVGDGSSDLRILNDQVTLAATQKSGMGYILTTTISVLTVR